MLILVIKRLTAALIRMTSKNPIKMAANMTYVVIPS